MFRPRDPEPAPEPRDDPEAGNDSEPGDDPLRAAVAAWVASVDEADPDAGPGAEPEPDAESDPEPGADVASGSAPERAEGSAAEAAPERAAGPGGDAAAGAPAAGRADRSAPEAASGAAAETAPEAAAEADPEPVAKPASGSAGGPARERDGGAEGARTDVRAPRTSTADRDSASAAPVAPAGAEVAREASAKPSPTPRADADVNGPESSDSERTSVFRTVPKDSAEVADSAPAEEKATAFEAFRRNSGSPKKDSASGQDPRSAAPADNERTAVFRAVRPDAAPADTKRPAPAGAKDAAPEPEAKAPADSERTAVFRAVRPDAAPAGAKDAAAESEAKAPAKAPVDNERTAVFRAVRPDAAPADTKRPAPAGAKDAAPEPEAKAKAPADSERTAVFRAVRPDAAPADTKRPAPADPTGSAPEEATGRGTGQGTGTAARQDPGTRQTPGKPAVPAPGQGAGTGPAARQGTGTGTRADKSTTRPREGAAERASTFVPLRGEGAPAPAEPKPTPSPASKTPPPPPPVTHTGSERTTQQPLPPRPPLDMLAELTNNPPPPPSPIRTTVRRVKIYAPLLALLAVVLGIVQLVRPLPAPTLAMTAKHSYAFAGDKPDLPWPDGGQAYMAAAGLGTLGSSGEMKPVPIASVTKSMTAYIILRDHPFKKGEKGQMIDIDKTAETEGKKNNSTDNESTLDTVMEGQKISEYDAIAALMIPSANNIARLLARWDSGSQEAFVAKMNATAKELGMANTTYTDPSGLDATTVSTAEDQVKLGLRLVEMDALLDITRKPSWVDPSGKTWPNWNRLVPFNDSLGIKTGTTTKAGGNLLFAAQKKVGDTNQLIVGAVLGQHKPPIIDTVIAASKQLLVATQKSLQGATVVKKGDVVGYVDDGLGGHTPVVATADVQAVGWSGLTVTVKLSDGGTKIPGTAKAGTQVGVLTVGEGASQVKVPVALQRELATPGIGSKLTRVG
ncbi:hypothetical protein ABZY31_18845 [Streptomyces sp. NPDC006529]|uniref:hypothetical protein n=1 Tax=Streptomyces sp. NPDC006529 TaxID=3157177 RepID=UPI0033A2511A